MCVLKTCSACHILRLLHLCGSFCATLSHNSVKSVHRQHHKLPLSATCAPALCHVNSFTTKYFSQVSHLKCLSRLSMHVIDANSSLYSTYTMSLKCTACTCVLDETFLHTFIHCRHNFWMLKLDQLELSFVKLSFVVAGVINSL